MNESHNERQPSPGAGRPKPCCCAGTGEALLILCALGTARLSSPGAPTALAGDLRLAVAPSGGRGGGGGCPRRLAAGSRSRARRAGRCCGRGRGGSAAPGTERGRRPLPPGRAPASEPSPRASPRFLPSRSGPPPSFYFFFSRLYYYFFPFSAKQKFCPQSQAGCGGFFSLPKPRRAKPPERRCPEGSGGRQEKNSVLRLRALWRGSQGPQPFCTLSSSASSARVSAQPRYCFHMFLQETSGVRSLVGMLTGYRNACE